MTLNFRLLVYYAFVTGLIIFTLNGCAQLQYVHIGPNWDKLNSLEPGEPTFEVFAEGVEKIHLGEKLSFSVKSEKSGRLWIAQVSPDDQLSIVFPNSEVADNSIQGGVTVHIPPKEAEWALIAEKPSGPNIMAFIVTTGDADIADILTEGKNSNKSIKIRGARSWGIAKLVIGIEQR